MTQPPKSQIWGALWVVYIVWGTTYLAIEYSIRSMPPILAMGMRFLAASFLMALFISIKWGIGFLAITRRQTAALALLGALLLGLGLGSVTLAQYNDVPTGIVALLIAALPLWIATFKAIDGVASSRWGWLGIIIGFFGVGILLLPELRKPDNSSHLFWMAMVIVGNFAWSLGTYIAPRLGLPKSTMVVTTYQMLLGGISMSLVALVTGERLSDFFDATFFSWMWWLFLVLIGSIATYSAYLWLVKYSPVGLIATYAYVNPVIAVTIGAIVLNEKLSTTLLIGAAVVITGVVMVVRAESRAVATQVQPSA